MIFIILTLTFFICVYGNQIVVVYYRKQQRGSTSNLGILCTQLLLYDKETDIFPILHINKIN